MGGASSSLGSPCLERRRGGAGKEEMTCAPGGKLNEEGKRRSFQNARHTNKSINLVVPGARSWPTN